MNDDELSLIEKSIHRTAVTAKEFEAKLGVPLRNITKLENECSHPVSFSSGKTKRKTLRAVIQKWIEKKSRKGKQKVKFLSNDGGDPRSLMDQYVKRVSRSTHDDNSRTEYRNHEEKKDGYSSENDEMGCAVGNYTPTTSLSFYRPDGGLYHGEVSFSERSESLVLKCAAVLYYQLWYFRAVQGKDVSRAYGFVVTPNSNTMLILEKPEAGAIGGRYTLYESSSCGLEEDLGPFLFTPSHLSSPMSHNNLTPLAATPGFMLLPCRYALPHGCQVIPTITGSLVIRCESAEAVTKLLLEHDDNDDEVIRSFVANFQKMVHSSEKNSNEESSIWYVKVKTPPFGLFWDTARLAINGTRSLLLRQTSSSMAKEWLRIHPIDSLTTENRSITILRSAGHKLNTESSLPLWTEFQLEFAALMKRTLQFQALTHLIHGDIHEGNVLYNEQAIRGSRLSLIDWDEALRNQPCPRQIGCAEERLRYPPELRSFPEQYTKQQFLHLFDAIEQKYYSKEMKNLDAVQDDQSLSRTAVDARFKILAARLRASS